MSDPNFVEAIHVAVHCFPIAATTEPRRRACRDCFEHGHYSSGNLGWASVKEIEHGHRSVALAIDSKNTMSHGSISGIPKC
jgi:hypothetical protein